MYGDQWGVLVYQDFTPASELSQNIVTSVQIFELSINDSYV